MAYTVANLKNDLEAIIHGTSINKVQNITDLINRSARELLLEVDPIETIRSQQIANAVYDQVYNYAAPADLKGNRVISIRPQVLRDAGDKATQRYEEEFDQFKRDEDFTVVYDSGVKFLRYSKNLTNPIVVNACNDLTDNGTWSAIIEKLDVSQTTVSTGQSLGITGDSEILAQSFTVTENNMTRVSFRTGAINTSSSDVVVSIQGDAAGDPDGVDLVSVTITNDNWVANDWIKTINLPTALVASTTYWLVFTPSSTDAANKKEISIDNDGSGITGQTLKRFDGGSWVDVSRDIAVEIYVNCSTNTNLTKNQLNYISGGASLNFDVTNCGTVAAVENSTMTAVNLSEQEDQAGLFVWVYMPVTITEAILLWGSSSNNYWSNTTTTRQDALTFQVGWNLLRFDWNGAFEIGSPDSTAIDYIKILLTYDGNSDTDYRIDNITSQTGRIFDIYYYSSYLFQNSTTGVWKEETDDDDDIINLDVEGRNLLLWRVSLYAAQQIQSGESSFDVSFFMTEYDKALKIYKNKYKSQVKSVKQAYYRIPKVADFDRRNKIIR